MGVVLPGWADELLDLIGVSWPNVDEDDYREMANAMREFADDIDEGADEAHTAIQSLVSSAGGSLAVEALNSHWGKINSKHLKGLADCGRMAGTAMDGVALLIEGAKIGALVQLGILAAEVIAAQAAAPFTLGLSELGAMGATQATRMILKRLFKEVCQQVAEQVVSIALTPVEEALGAMVGDLVVQLGANAFGVKDGVDLGQTAKAGKEGFAQGVQKAKGAAKSAADNPMELLSAGGSGGGSDAGAGGSGGFSFDADEHDRAVTSLESAGGTFRNKAGGKIGRAKSHHGRTRGKDAIADAANTVLDKVIEGIEDGVKKTAKHLDDNMTRGIKQMAKNHHDNDKGLADHFKGLGKNAAKGSKAPGTGGAAGGGRGQGGGKGAGGSGSRPPGGSDAPQGQPINPPWHGKSAWGMKNHHGRALDVSGLNHDQRLRQLEEESRRLADDAHNAPPGQSGVETPGAYRIKNGCAGSFLHNGVITGHTSSTKFGGRVAIDVHPELKKMLDDIEREGNISAGHGKCAEVALISDRLRGLDPDGTRLTSEEALKRELAGGVMHTNNIGDRKRGGELIEGHGDYKPPCDSCKRMLPRLGIIPHRG
ncbi:YwqJ-related putative deaminase [Streptomyces sp. RS10V-4]|uniref:WXG100-like domain-containing protein n=1 Tax=Streptomyces rhizoryzae TaxID=2932493 RepID=UPI0020050F7F|nr:YwqJ-related putative deaminase [Streptomyces rhizoryzae]MCK7627688.1 YwqJ-related putative deaminase [Streptomyces rhizoryzae]